MVYRLLLHYDGYHRHSSHPADRFRGGQGEIARTLSEAAAYDPLRYFALLPELEDQGLSASYAVSILQGIANHLRYRFGRLQLPSGKDWKHIEPPPDGLVLAKILINSAEQFAPLWQDGYVISHIIEACCKVVEDAVSAEPLVFLLFRLRKHPDPEKTEQRIFTQGKEGITSDDVLHDAFNRVRGVAAGAAMTVARVCWKRRWNRRSCFSRCCVGHAFNLEKNGKLLDADFAVLFIKRMHINGNGFAQSQLFDWIAWLAQKNAREAIEVCECLMDKFVVNGTAVNSLWHSEPLVAALTIILREADESEDAIMINRAVRLQDQFLRMDIVGMEEFLDQAVKL